MRYVLTLALVLVAAMAIVGVVTLTWLAPLGAVPMIWIVFYHVGSRIGEVIGSLWTAPECRQGPAR